MTTPGWARVEELFHAALEKGALEREKFLDEACGGGEGWVAAQPGGPTGCGSLTVVEEGILTEIVFVAEEAPEGGYTARALGASIFTEADTLEALQANVRDAVRCHFEESERPRVVRLHFVRDQLIAV